MVRLVLHFNPDPVWLTTDVPIQPPTKSRNKWPNPKSTPWAVPRILRRYSTLKRRIWRWWSTTTSSTEWKIDYWSGYRAPYRDLYSNLEMYLPRLASDSRWVSFDHLLNSRWTSLYASWYVSWSHDLSEVQTLFTAHAAHQAQACDEQRKSHVHNK